MSASTSEQCLDVSTFNLICLSMRPGPSNYQSHAYYWLGWRERIKKEKTWSEVSRVWCSRLPEQPHFFCIYGMSLRYRQPFSTLLGAAVCSPYPPTPLGIIYPHLLRTRSRFSEPKSYKQRAILGIFCLLMETTIYWSSLKECMILVTNS